MLKKHVNHFVHVACIMFVLFSLSDVSLPLDLFIFMHFLIALTFNSLPPFYLSVSSLLLKYNLFISTHPKYYEIIFSALCFMLSALRYTDILGLPMLFSDPDIFTYRPLDVYGHLSLINAVPSLLHYSYSPFPLSVSLCFSLLYG